MMLFGRDEEMVSALEMGASGFVGSTYNYAGRLFNALLKARAEKDTGACVPTPPPRPQPSPPPLACAL